MNLRYSLFTLLILCCFNQSVRAGLDVFGNGTGRDGALTVTATNTIINNYALVTAPVAPGDFSITIGTPSGPIASGDLVMIWQATGLVPAPATGSQTAIDLSNNPVGRWEFARVASVTGSTVSFTSPCIYSYASNVTQVVRVPEYTNLTINAGRSIVAKSWDGSTGGIVVFLAQGTVSLVGNIDASARGGRAGLYVDDFTGSMGSTGLDEPAPSGAQKGEGVVNTRYGVAHTGRGNVANGGGGGVALNSGGGGGANRGAGGRGGRTHSSDASRAMGGLGGAALLYAPLDHLLMGGGGGAGHGDDGTGAAGGTGGGVVFIRCNQTTGTGNILTNGANGANATDDGGSGGGAGGTVYLRTTGNATFGAIRANGALGGSIPNPEYGPGGGGGGGAVLLQRCTGTGSPVTNSGSAGTQTNAAATDGITYGAAAGTAGLITTLSGCTILPATPALVIPASGAVLKKLTTISGTGPASTSIALYVDNVLLNTVTSDAAGNFTYTHTGSLSDGVHTLNAYATVQALYSTPATVSFTTLATLPVQLLSFKATRTKSGIALNWTTGQESNSQHFTLERSHDGRSFTALGNVPAAGYSSTPKTYDYTDAHPAAGINYYRLKSFDLDGRFTYSNMLLIRLDGAQSLDIFPNPVADLLNMQLQAKAGSLLIQVIDANGKVVLKKQLVTDGAILSTFINVQSLQPGVYYIQANDEKRKFIKL